MSTLTKICIVVLVVLLLFACPVFIQQAVTGPNWMQAYTEEKAEHESTRATAKNQMLAAQVWQRLYEETKTKAENSAGQFERVLGDKDIKIMQLQQQMVTCQAQMNELSASLKVAQQNESGLIRRNGFLSNELKTQREKNIALDNQLRRAQDSIKEYQANEEIVRKSVVLLKRQVAQRDTRIADLQKQVAAGGLKVGPKVMPKAPKIEATVMAVRRDVASLNVGSASGVKKGMRFYLYRPDSPEGFVGYLRIEEVYASTCAGVIEEPQLDVRQGDKATTSLESD